MWLHGHPINRRRTSRGEMPVSTLWLWGGGGSGSAIVQPSSAGVSDPPHTAGVPPAGRPAGADVGFGSDPYFTGLWRLQDLEPMPLPEGLPNFGSYSHAHRMALIAEVTPLLHANPSWTLFEALADLDRRFIAPAVAALRTGELATVALVANDVLLQINRRDPLKLWRRGPKSVIEALSA
jgi:hypothetical protein